MENNTTSNAISSLSAVLLTIVFFVAKVTGYIDWPWIWVLSPLWLGTVIVIALFVVYLIVMAIIAIWVNK